MKASIAFALLLMPLGMSAQVEFSVNAFTPDINGLGAATLTWSVPSATVIQIHVNGVNGALLVQGANIGSSITGEWVTDGMQFYLQDTSLGVPGVTVAAITAHPGPPATLVGSPQPYKPDSAGLGQISLSWSAGPDVTATEIHVNSATGPLLAGGTGSGSANTGEWVTAGMPFFLQNVSHGHPGSTLKVFTADSGSLVSGPYLVATGQQLYYSAPNATTVEIHVDKPWGALLARLSGGTGSVSTGSWEWDGMRFFLQDVSNGQPLTAQYTLASAIASYPDQSPPLPSSVLLGATPGVISDPNNSKFAATTLFWNAPGYSGLELHVNAPDGPLFASSTSGVGTATTGQWVTDGMRFYLQDPSSSQTIGIATVDLQPATQHYVSFYEPPNGLLIFSRESGHRIGTIAGSSFPLGVTGIDLHTSPDGTLIYMLGSDFNYYVLDPATDSVVATFAVGSQPATPAGSVVFTFMKGPAGQDLLIAAPDAQGNISIVDPSQKATAVTINCQCSGQLSLYYNQFNNTTYFFDPVIGRGSQIFGVTQSLQLVPPIEFGPVTSAGFKNPMSYTWSLLSVDNGPQGALVTPNFTATGQSLQGEVGPLVPFDVFISDGAGIYDLPSGGTASASFNPESVSPNPESVSPDGQSIYGRLFTVHTLLTGALWGSQPQPPDGECDITSEGLRNQLPTSQCYQSIGVTRYQLSSAADAPAFTPAASLAMPSVAPPSAFDESYAYLLWRKTDTNGNPVTVNTPGFLYNCYSSSCEGWATIRKVDPNTLQPVPGDNPIPFIGPAKMTAPTSGVLVGKYIYTGNGPTPTTEK